ncbi:DUF4403 family protein [Spirosoma sp. BT702]|uniref:DUF4403 family protein n=1 Tax=Spirosoma profusum TaxID=2771354 RepID=A0A926XWP8_9BACT|nr:DUF4403 family protein [Spirosoma profusum]MBD2702173.1 DUF4403 family protein [Spirosoma profusum]
MKRLILPVLTGLSLLLLQCQKKEPRAPEAIGFDPPIQERVSYVAGSITFQLKELQDKINRELDPVLVGKGSKNGENKGVISFRVKRTGPVQVRYADNQISLSAPLQMWLTKPFSKDTTPPKKQFSALHVSFKSPISVTPNWRLASRTKFAEYRWIKEPDIRLLGKDISLTNMAQKILENFQSSIETAIDSALYKDLRLDRMVRPIWRDLQKPLLINKEFGLWLLPKPVSVAASNVTGNAKSLTTHLRIAFNTKTEVKPQTPSHLETPLPQLQKREKVDSTSELHVLSAIPYVDINRMLALNIKREPKKMALGTVTLKGATVYGGQHALIIKAEVDGLLNGLVYLKGRPMFDTASNTLRINNLDFDAETGSLLSKDTGALWHAGLRKILGELVTISLGNEIEQLPQKISKAFEKGKPGEKTDLGLQSFKFVPENVAIRPDEIQVMIRVETKVGVRVNKL